MCYGEETEEGDLGREGCELQMECALGKGQGGGFLASVYEIERQKPKEGGEKKISPICMRFVEAGKHPICPCIFALL